MVVGWCADGANELNEMRWKVVLASCRLTPRFASSGAKEDNKSSTHVSSPRYMRRRAAVDSEMDTSSSPACRAARRARAGSVRAR